MPVAFDTGNPDDLAGVHVEVEPVEHGDAAVVHGGVRDPQHHVLDRLGRTGDRLCCDLLDDVGGTERGRLVA